MHDPPTEPDHDQHTSRGGPGRSGAEPTGSAARSRPAFQVDQAVEFGGAGARIREISVRSGRTAYRIDSGPAAVPMWVPEDVLVAHQERGGSAPFQRQTPHLVAVDDFFADPDEIRAVALAAGYAADLRYYKGLRSTDRYLWPHLREELARLLGAPVVEWLGHPANGVFQKTGYGDPLVWHHDTQSYAAAVYLNPDPPPGAGTTFWRDRTHGCRRAPRHPAERRRLGSDEAVAAAEGAVYDPYNIEHPDNWELVESVAGLYNRLVIWDAKLIHSATSYEGFAVDGSSEARLVQLFFFDVAAASPAG